MLPGDKDLQYVIGCCVSVWCQVYRMARCWCVLLGERE